MNLQAHTITLTLQEDTLQISIALPHQHWQSIQQAPYLLYHQKSLLLHKRHRFIILTVK